MATEKSADKVYEFPKTMGACADRLYTLREKRLGGQRLVDEVDNEEKALKAHIILTLPKSEASGVAGKLARVTVVTKKVPQAEDWDLVRAYIKKNNAFDLLNKALNKSAVEERWAAGKVIPGVKSFDVVTVSINKL